MEAKVDTKEEVAILDDEGVNKTTKIYTNLQVFILTLLLKIYSIHMAIGSISVENSVVQCTKIICNMYRLIVTLQHQDFYSMTKDRL